jgi:hypothetical protein
MTKTGKIAQKPCTLEFKQEAELPAHIRAVHAETRRVSRWLRIRREPVRRGLKT